MGQHRNRKKYKFITVNSKTVREHRFVVEKKIGRKLQTCEAIHHKDSNGTNNDLTNLEIIDYKKHCQMESRKARPGTKLTIEDVRDIRKMLADGIQQWLIGIAFGIRRMGINNINCGRTWSWL